MARLPDILGALTPDAQKVYDRITAKRGKIGGPYVPLMHHPALAEHVADLGEYLRFGSTLPGDLRELAILITARHVTQPFEWIMHAPVALKEGLPAEIIEHIRSRGDLSTLPARYVRAARVVRHVLAREPVPQTLQDEAEKEVGVTGVVELVVLAGYYQTIAAVLFAFDVPLPEGTPAPF
ncbi:MAG TPA: carboxymuconolactone decarboxylase family protein [Terriglobales bacterium]|nr:carboxymuconolactone decarboxylase family protein [Terriglobales bacterium]